MAIYKKGMYDLYMYKGDTGNIKINGIPTNGNYYIYLNITYAEGTVDEDGSSGYELYVESHCRPEVIIPISTIISDKLPVGIHTYAVKLCLQNDYDQYTEETVIPPLKNTNLTPLNFKNKAYFSVYPKQVEGIEGE